MYELYNLRNLIVSSAAEWKKLLEFLLKIKNLKMVRIESIHVIFLRQIWTNFLEGMHYSGTIPKDFVVAYNNLVSLIRSDRIISPVKIESYAFIPIQQFEQVPVELNEIVFELQPDTFLEIRQNLKEYKNVKVNRVKIIATEQFQLSNYEDLINDINNLEVNVVEIMFSNSLLNWNTIGWIIESSSKLTCKSFELWWISKGKVIWGLDLLEKEPIMQKWNRIYCKNPVISICIPSKKEIAYFQIDELWIEYWVEIGHFAVSENGIIIIYPKDFRMKFERARPLKIPIEVIRWSEYVFNNTVTNKMNEYLYLHNSLIQKWVYECSADIANVPTNLKEIKLINFDLDRSYTEGFLLKFLKETTTWIIHWSGTSNLEQIKKNLEMFNDLKIDEISVNTEKMQEKKIVKEVASLLSNIKKIRILEIQFSSKNKIIEFLDEYKFQRQMRLFKIWYKKNLKIEDINFKLKNINHWKIMIKDKNIKNNTKFLQI